MNLIFASNNKGKIAEVQSLINGNLAIVSLREAGITEDIPEPFDTFRENALAKAGYVYRKTGADCFAEDSGLVVPALQGAPGVHSARYAGEPSNDEANNRKLIDALQRVSDRTAWYQAVICLIKGGETYYFEGICTGKVSDIPSGAGGFGYDPLFTPDGYNQTFAQLSLAEKNSISHRAKAMRALTDFLNRHTAG